MEIYIGADHRGFRMKNDLLIWFHEHGYEVIDVGSHAKNEDDDYVEYAKEVAEAVAQDPENRRGILLCGSGVGMDVSANKVSGIRAGLIHDVNMVKNARHDDDINILALGADYITQEMAEQVVQTFLKTAFSKEERYTRRIEKISKLEKNG